MNKTNPIPLAFRIRPSETEKYNVTLKKEPGENSYVFSGEYEDLMKFLTGYLSMTDSEADIEIAEEHHNSDESFADVEHGFNSARTSGSGRPFENKITLKSLLMENPPGSDPITGEFDNEPGGCDSCEDDRFKRGYACPMCSTDHADPNTTCDYEECGECGFDHTYEYEQAATWHTENDPENKLYEDDDAVNEARVVTSPETSSLVVDMGGLNHEAQSELVGVLRSRLGKLAATDSDGVQFKAHHIDPSKFAIASRIAHRSLDDVMNAYGYASMPRHATNENKVAHEPTGFDRFMNVIMEQESGGKNRLLVEHDSKQRLRAQRHQERPLGRIVIGRKK